MMVDGAATPPLVYFRDERLRTLSHSLGRNSIRIVKGGNLYIHTHTQKVDNITDTLCVDGVAARVS